MYIIEATPKDLFPGVVFYQKKNTLFERCLTL